ncbi:MAG: MFS transporter [Dehalococcoidia bacterium]|nr:MFS transporter [Dehalococcoidia bacterium]
MKLGLRANWHQFALLVAVNACVGGMVGLERTILPLLAESEFGITSKTAAVSFISTFGLAKALTNLFAGHASGRFSRKRLLVAGWLVGLPVPFVLMWAPAWGWIVAANLLLGINQGLTWSMTVNMKVDLVGPRQRGLALGINEAAGYMAVAAAAYMTGVIAQHYGLRPEPFYLGVVFVACGLALSTLLVKDTGAFVALEATQRPPTVQQPLRTTFAEASWRRPRLWGISQAGLVNNLNDGLIWGIFPLFFASKGLSIERIAILASLYPLMWGALQLLTGWLSDVAGRRPLIVGGMLLQGLAIWLASAADSYALWMLAVALVGIGTAMVYPTLLAAIGDAVHPQHRASTLGVYRFWRDAGAIAGALLGGILADALGFSIAIQTVAAITILSGVVAAFTVAGRKPHELQTSKVVP